MKFRKNLGGIIALLSIAGYATYGIIAIMQIKPNIGYCLLFAVIGYGPMVYACIKEKGYFTNEVHLSEEGLKIVRKDKTLEYKWTDFRRIDRAPGFGSIGRIFKTYSGDEFGLADWSGKLNQYLEKYYHYQEK